MPYLFKYIIQKIVSLRDTQTATYFGLLGMEEKSEDEFFKERRIPMKNHWALVLMTYTVICCLVGCGSPQAQTEVSQPPTAILNPTAIETPLPPTAMLIPTATKTPKPTWTPRLYGTFIGCIYYQGELVDGQFNFADENGDISYLVTQVGSSGCTTKQLSPGIYEVAASYWKRDCATFTGCGSEVAVVEIKLNETIELDFETRPR